MYRDGSIVKRLEARVLRSESAYKREYLEARALRSESSSKREHLEEL